MSDTKDIQLKENKMGVLPIPKLLLTMSLPMILSMLVQALYNIVDSIFVAQISEDALTAVSLVFPVQNLIISIAVGTGVGVNALLSRNLGEHRYDEANAAARNGIFLAVISYICIALLGGFGSRLFFHMQTSNPVILNYGISYMSIVTIISFGSFMQITSERLLQSTGKTVYSMITQGIGAIVNIILDPILIFGLFGFPRLEVAGAALATVIGQCVGASLGLYFNITKNKEINLNMRRFRPSAQTIKNIYEVGVPSIVMQSVGSVMTFGMNKILLMFSSTAAAVFGIYFKLQSFIFMPIFGLNSGMIPIIAFNYGARDKSRIVHTIKLSIGVACVFMAVGLCLFQIMPETMLLLFDASERMMNIGVPALRIISLSFLFAGYCIVIGSVFQALGNGVYSLVMSIARQLITLLPVAFVFAELFGLHMVWWSFPIAEIVSVTIGSLLLKRIYRLKINTL